MKLNLFLIFLLILPISLAVTYLDDGITVDPRDCVDVELFTNDGYLEDGTPCPTSTAQCIPQFSKCAICIHPGAEENCYDQVDNDCNDNNGNWDNETSSGIDFNDPACGENLCRLDEAYWDKTWALEGDIVDLVVDAPHCDSQIISFKLKEDDPIKDDELTGPEFTIPDLTLDENPDSQPWTVSFHISNDDGKDKNNIPKDLQYKFTAEMEIEGYTVDETSGILNVRYCDKLIDEDCDKVCNPGQISMTDPKACIGQDNCPHTPLGDEVDEYGCSSGQSSCLVFWDCSGVQWSECDEDTYTKTIISGSCIKKSDFPLECEGSEIYLPTEKSCLESLEFPFFTNLNIFLVITILTIYYLFKKK